MSTAIIPGIRPEIIKMSPVIRELDHKRRDFLLFSGFNNHRELRGHREKQHRSVISVYPVVDEPHCDSFFQNKFKNNKPQINADKRRSIALFHHKERKAPLHKSLNSEEIIRTGTRISRIGRIYTDPCPSIFSQFIFKEEIENHENYSH